MGNRKFSIDCFKVTNSDCDFVNTCYNCNFSVGDLYYQLNIPDGDYSNSPVSCFTFSSLDAALDFVHSKFML